VKKFLWLFLLLPSLALAQGGNIGTNSSPITNVLGQAIPGVSVAICTSPATMGNSTTPCSPLAPIFSDPTLTMPIQQPQLTDSGGDWNAFAVPGVYQVQFYGQNVQTTMKQIVVGCVPNGSLTNCPPIGPGIALNGNNPWTGNETHTGIETFKNSDGIRWVDGTLWTTIQLAITDAGTSGAVVIDPNYPGSDSFTNPNSIPIIDLRNGAASYTRTFDVKSFGAKGDGSTDDTTAIQAALTAASGKNAKVLFPCSTNPYLISTTLTYGPQTFMDAPGNHCATIRVKSGLGQTIIMMQPTSVGEQGSRMSNIVLDQATDVYTTVSANIQLLSVDGTIGMILDNVEFKNVMTMAVWVDSAMGSPTKKLVIRNCRVDNALGDGFSFFGYVLDALLEGNIIENTDDDGIGFQQSINGGSPTGVAIIGNLIRNVNVRNSLGSTPRCIDIFGAVTNFAISSNSCDSSVGPGIEVQNDVSGRPAQGVISGNVINNAGNTASSVAGVPGAGIEIELSDNISIAGNTIVASRGCGIRVLSATGLSLSGNVARLNGDCGLQIEASQRMSISGNTLLDNGNGFNSVASTIPYGFLLINDSASAGQFDDRVTLSSNVSGDSRSGGARTQTYGFFVACSCGTSPGTIRVALNNFQDNVTGAFGGISSATLLRFENAGDTTISNLVNGISTPSISVSALMVSNTAPTIAGAGCGGSAAAISGTPNGTAAFAFSVGTAPGIACTLTLPTAPTAWNCFAFDQTSNSNADGSYYIKQTGGTLATVLFTFFAQSGIGTAPPDNDIIRVGCLGY
jgi:parallel beta-helix repeat protein